MTTPDATLTRSLLAPHWRALVAEGVILVLLGAAAIVLPGIASLAVALVLGWIFLIGGAIGLVTTIAARGMPGFWWALLSALITIAAGVLLLIRPGTGVISLTLVLTAFLIADGIVTIFFGLVHRDSPRWVWLVVNGVLDLFLAAFIIWGFPGTAVWVLGLIVGIDLVFGGTSLIGLALAARPR